jgi:hypothetical protein
LGNTEEIIFGNTPMYEALEKVVQRFKDELSERPANTKRALCIISDGEPTDCKSLQSMKEDLEHLGITIISCFVTDKDLTHPRTLAGTIDSKWDEGAQIMFNMASPFKMDTEIDKYLKKRNMELEEKASQYNNDEEKRKIKGKQWTIAPDARLFAQINHSEHLEEFIDFTLRVFGEQDVFDIVIVTLLTVTK